MEVDPLWQVSSEVWFEPAFSKFLILTPFKRQGELKINLNRWDISGSYSGQGWIGGLNLHRNRIGNTELEIKLHEAGLSSDAPRLSSLIIKMPSNKNNKVEILSPKRIQQIDSPSFVTMLDTTIYNRRMDNGRNPFTRAQLLKPLFQGLGIAMGVTK